MLKHFILYSIRVYQFIHRFFPGCCRYYPSCSTFTIKAIQLYGITKGVIIGTKRILTCHPWHKPINQRTVIQ